VLREHFAVNVVQSLGPASVASHNWIGQITPLHAIPSGKVWLAHLDATERADLIRQELERFTPNTHTDPATLEDEFGVVLERGHATTFSELEIGHPPPASLRRRSESHASVSAIWLNEKTWSPSTRASDAPKPGAQSNKNRSAVKPPGAVG
jgi:Bacterial transcriptional regulator